CHYGPGRQRAHRLFAALPADSRRVRLGARHDGWGVFFWLPRLGGPEPLRRPPDGSPWAKDSNRDGGGSHGRWVDAGPTDTPAMAPVCHTRCACQWGYQLSGLYWSIALSP